MKIHKNIYDIKIKLSKYLNFESTYFDTILYKNDIYHCVINFSIMYKVFNIQIHKNNKNIFQKMHVSENETIDIITKYLSSEIRKNKIKHLI